ncbi:MAG: efflux transporter outer membrane subunit [Gammaproteobacteria bacterium]
MSFPLKASSTSAVILVTAITTLSGCVVGPDYKGAPSVAPEAIHSATFRRTPAEGITTAPAAAKWWEALGDSELTQLVESALARSPDLRAAEARLRESRAGLRQKRQDLLPKGAANAAYLHAKLPTGTLDAGSIDFYNVGFDATWEIDLFGGTRRTVEGARADAEAVDADLTDRRVQLAAEVAQAYVELRDRQQRIALVRKSADLEDQVLDLTQQRRARGVASDLEVERVRTQVENTRAAIIPLDAERVELLDELAVLTGREPGALDAELAASAPLPQLPATIAVNDPATLLRQRPDIRAAEWHLVSKNAAIGARIADRFPKVTLLGFIGFSSSDVGSLLDSKNLTWVGAPLLQWNALDFGRTGARVEQARASFEEAEATYEGVVLRALKDANSALSRYGHQRDSVVSLRKVEASAARSAILTEQRYRAGTTSALKWLDSERTRFSAEQNRISAEAQLIQDFVSLQKSLGLGWQAPRPTT